MANFQELSEVLSNCKSELPTSEVHGLLSALVCVPGQSRMAVLQGEVLGHAVEDPSAALVRDALEHTWRHTSEALDSSECTFDLLLPDDECSLDYRAEALGSWCTGFLAGLGLAGVGEHHKSLSTDAREFLDDLREMSRLDADMDDGDESEAAYAELVEYLRVGVLLLREEIGELAANHAGIGRLH
jgi:uncharacterized protein